MTSRVLPAVRPGLEVVVLPALGLRGDGPAVGDPQAGVVAAERGVGAGRGGAGRVVVGAVAVQLSPTAQCHGAVYEAHAHASAKRLALALQALDAAAAWSDETRNEAPPTWLGIPGTSFVERQRGMILAQFGTTQAIPPLHRLEQNASAVFRRYRVTLATDLALTYAHSKEVEQSAEQLTSALQLNQQTRSPDRDTADSEDPGNAGPYQNSRAVRSLDEALKMTVKLDERLGLW